MHIWCQHSVRHFICYSISQFQFKVSVSASSDVKDQFDTDVPAPVQSVGGGCTGGEKCGM